MNLVSRMRDWRSSKLASHYFIGEAGGPGYDVDNGRESACVSMKESHSIDRGKRSVV